jgi:hypothetical protein
VAYRAQEDIASQLKETKSKGASEVATIRNTQQSVSDLSLRRRQTISDLRDWVEERAETAMHAGPLRKRSGGVVGDIGRR